MPSKVVNANLSNVTFGMIKPEAFERGLVTEIERRICAAGLVIEDKKVVVMTEEQVFILYGHIKARVPDIYAVMEKYLITNPVEVLKVRGRGALVRLLAVRGASNPSDAAPGTVRGDYAKDQGYDKRGKKLSLNVFHAADSVEEVKKALELFFGGYK